MENIKKFCTSFIILVFLIILFLPNFVLADDSPSYVISNYNIDAYININGSMHIDESFTYNFYSSANGFTRDLRYYYLTNKKDTMEPESPRYQASDIKNLKVSVIDAYGNPEEYKQSDSATNGDVGIYTLENINTNKEKGFDIKVYSPTASNRDKTVVYSYDIEDVAVQYNDMCEVYYNFVGSGIESDIEQFQLNLYLPDGSNINEVKYFPHTYATKLKNITINTDTTNNCVSFILDKIPSYTPFDVRMVFPNNNVMDCTKIYNNNYDFANLSNIENKMTLGNTRYFLHFELDLILVIIALFIFIIFIVYTKMKTKKYKFTIKKADYFRDIPKRLNLLQYQLLLPSKKTDSLNSSLIIATILDLVNKKALNMESISNPKRKGNIKYDYNLSLNKDFDSTGLQPYENQILSMLFTDNITTSFEFKNYTNKTIELNDRFKEISKSNDLIKQISKIRSTPFIKVKDMYDTLPSKTLKYLLIFSVIILLIFIINVLFISPSYEAKFIEFFIGSIFIICSYFILLIYISDALKIVKDEYKEDAKEIYGLFKYLKDYSLIKDRYPLEVNLWNEYLVFASLFGIADKVSKEFKEELINKGYTDDQINSAYPILCVSIYSHLFSTSIDSSTGYSGSGSGGGGGGGGGAGAF